MHITTRNQYMLVSSSFNLIIENKMSLLVLTISFGFAFITLAYGQHLSEHDIGMLSQDDCLRKILACSNYVELISEKEGYLITDTYKFEEMCSKQKKFIECVDFASIHCIGKLSNFSRKMLDNRQMAKKFCKNSNWKQRYFLAAPCLNRHMKWIVGKCKEEEKYGNRKLWYMSHNTCDEMKWVFSCKVEKIEMLCGLAASGIYKRIYKLEQGTLDYMCERPCQTRECKFKISTNRKELKVETAKTIDQKQMLSGKIKYLASSIFKVVNDIARAVSVDIIANLVEQEEAYDRNEPDSEEIVQKTFHETVSPEGIEINVNNILGKTNMADSVEDKEDTWGIKINPVSDNLQIKSARHSIHKLDAVSNSQDGNFDDHIVSGHFQDATKTIENASPDQIVENISEFHTVIECLEDSVLKLYDLLKSGKDIEASAISDKQIVLHWKNMGSNPLLNINCEWINKWSNKIFKCDFKIKALPMNKKKINFEPIDLMATVDIKRPITLTKDSSEILDIYRI